MENTVENTKSGGWTAQPHGNQQSISRTRRKHGEIISEEQPDGIDFLQEGGGEAVPPPPELRYFSNGVGLSGFCNPALIVIK